MHTEEFRYHRSESRFSPISQPIIQSALRVQSVDALRTWIQTEVNAVIPHRSALLLLGRCTPLGVTIVNKLAVNIPPAFMQAIEDEHGQIHCPYLARWHATGESQLISGSKVDFLSYPKWKTAFFSNELQPGLLDVSIDNPSKTRLFLYLFGVRVPVAEAMRIVASVVTPFAHDAWLRALNDSSIEVAAKSKDCAPSNDSMLCGGPVQTLKMLSNAELQVVDRLQLGKTTKEIARQLGKSDHTISKQLQSIYRKTGFGNRAELAIFLSRVGASAMGNTLSAGSGRASKVASYTPTGKLQPSCPPASLPAGLVQVAPSHSPPKVLLDCS